MGPLAGVKIVELAGIGPGPFAGMLLSDMGADIVRIDRAQQVNPRTFDKPNLEPLYRGRRSIGVDLKNPEGDELVLRLVESADALFEGYRPGRDRAARARARRLPRPQSEARLRAHDRLGPRGSDGPGGRPRHQLHRARGRARALRPGRRASPRRRSTSSATSAAAACSWRSASSAGSSKRSGRARVRSSTSRWSTAPPRS